MHIHQQARRLALQVAEFGVWWIIAALTVLVPGMGAHAQVGGLYEPGESYITPFPDGERYKLRVIGDEYGDGMHTGLTDALGSDPRLEIERKPVWLSGLTRPNSVDELKEIARGVASDKPQIAVIMFGSMDRWSYRGPNGQRYPVGTKEWRDVYTQRMDQLIRDLKAARTAVYWVGLPIMRRADVNEAAQIQNEVFRERAYLGGVRYVDVYQGFADEQGEYNPYGPDLAGKNRLLRDSDGMHMTDAGYQKLAHFVERVIKRDLNRAKSVRTIPLAGNETEQALINPMRHAKAAAGGGNWQTTSRPGAGSDVKEQGGSGDQIAETSRINLKSVGTDGREQVLAVEILRPAIPAAVIALVTRRESADRLSQMGDQVVDQIPGGLTVMSSITPGGSDGAAERRKLSPAQTPYFRVLVKGERIASRPGRADDVSWPLPKPPPPEAEPEVMPNAAPGIPLPVAKPNR
ncbi:MAG: GDSL-type esterase/lipase family protein [Hyphomicrobiaceae bacterium]